MQEGIQEGPINFSYEFTGVIYYAKYNGTSKRAIEILNELSYFDLFYLDYFNYDIDDKELNIRIAYNCGPNEFDGKDIVYDSTKIKRGDIFIITKNDGVIMGRVPTKKYLKTGDDPMPF